MPRFPENPPKPKPLISNTIQQREKLCKKSIANPAEPSAISFQLHEQPTNHDPLSTQSTRRRRRIRRLRRPSPRIRFRPTGNDPPSTNAPNGPRLTGVG